MLDPATDVDLVAGAFVSVANFSGCQYFSCQCLCLPVPQLPVSLPASTSAVSFSGCQYLSCQYLCFTCWYLCISCQSLGCLYFNCQCLCLGCRYLLVPWLVSTFCAMVAEDITKSVAEDSCEMIIEDTHESSAKMSCVQALVTSNNNR